MCIEGVSLSLQMYLAKSATFLASSEGTFDEDMNDSVLDLYKSSGIELRNLMLSKKASGRRICIVCYFWIRM